MKTHVCLVSDQAAANLLPALDLSLKPEKIILLVSRRMKAQAQHLSTVFKEVGIKVESIELTDEHDYRCTEEQLLEMTDTLTNDQVALNITGGTKLMSLAAQSVASSADWPMFYIDADTGRLVWLDKTPPHTLTENLRLPHYLQGYGFAPTQQRQRPQITAAQQTLADTLVRQIGSLESPLSQLNWLTQQAEEKRALVIEMSAAQRDSRNLETLLRNFEQAGSLSVQGGNIVFRSEADRSFVKGGWLETYVFQTIASQTGALNIRDSAINLEVVDVNGVKNELDVAFMARNRLFIIECKTARMDKPEAPKANDTLFKLAENSKRIGGSGTRRMLASYRALRDSEKRLAAALNIEIVSGIELIRLTEKLKTWLR